MLYRSFSSSVNRTANHNSASQNVDLRRKLDESLMKEIRSQLKIKDVQDWYKLTEKNILENKLLTKLIKRYDNSLTKALTSLFPEHKWEIWRFQVVEPHLRRSHIIKDVVRWMEKSLGLVSVTDWYNITQDSLIQFHNYPLLRRILTQESIQNILRKAYPEHDWQDHKFKIRVHRNYWKELKNQRDFLDGVMKLCNMTSMEDWYTKGVKDIQIQGGYSLLKHYKGSFIKMLTTVYPEHTWEVWRFGRGQVGFWQNSVTARGYLEKISKELNLKTWTDWYNVTTSQLQRFNINRLLRYYRSLPAALLSLFPEYPWEIWKFERVYRGHWSNKNTQREFLMLIGDKLGVESLEDWYKFTRADVNGAGGSKLMSKHSSYPAMIMNIFPEHPWKLWLFKRQNSNLLLTKDNIENTVKFLSDAFKIENPDDWYRISHEQLQKFGNFSLIRKYGGLQKLLEEVYPEYKWNKGAFKSTVKKSSQRWLILTLKTLFPNESVIEEFEHPNARFPSGASVTYDAYLPNLKLALEYQGKHHYSSIHVFGDVRHYWQRDKEKREESLKRGITLLEVPFWWDRTTSSLAATIHSVRPDLLNDKHDLFVYSNTIPPTPPTVIKR